MMQRYAHAIYCDDIRHEIGGKTTLVGVYGDALIVHKFPQDIPKLCIRLEMATPASQPFETISIHVALNDKILGETTLDKEQIGPPPHNEKSDADGQMVQVLRFDFVLPPMTLNAPGALNFKIITEKGQLPAPTLLIQEHH